MLIGNSPKANLAVEFEGVNSNVYVHHSTIVAPSDELNKIQVGLWFSGPVSPECVGGS